MNNPMPSIDTIRAERDEAKSEVGKLKRMLGHLFDWLETAINILRAIIYAGSALMAWFYLHDKVLAVAIVCSLTISHLLMEAMAKVKEKQKELNKW